MKKTKIPPTMIDSYIRMWPRQVYYLKNGKKHLESIRGSLWQKSGIYILYRADGVPYYIGLARNLWRRIRNHAINQNAKHYHHWTHFSAFILSDIRHMRELEALIIAAFGFSTANGSLRRMKRILLPKDARIALTQKGNILSGDS
jgi:hypothetical protein